MQRPVRYIIILNSCFDKVIYFVQNVEVKFSTSNMKQIYVKSIFRYFAVKINAWNMELICIRYHGSISTNSGPVARDSYNNIIIFNINNTDNIQ